MSTGVNAHVFTDPNADTTEYYWIRVLDDTKYGISGFVHVANLDTGKFYHVAPKSIEFISKTHMNVYAEVMVGDVERILEVTLATNNGKNFAGFEVTQVSDPSIILDFSPMISCETGGYIRTVGKIMV